jgi:hypothetical protein
VTFKFKFDAPYSGAFIGRLRDLSNVLLIETPAADGDSAFSFIPEVSQNGQMVSAASNPAGLLEFTNCELAGFKAFFASNQEIDRATQAQSEGVSFLAEMLARSQELCRGVGFADDLGMAPQLYAAKRGSGSGTNLPPNANPQDVTVTEDVPKSITLGASDPDGDPLTFTITKQPEHGTLSGSGATRTYTPDNNYVGADDFSFKATDDNGADSNTAKVSITVGPGNDAPVVTNSSGASTYTEQEPATKVDTGLTVSDIDDTQLNGATVKVASGFQSGDALVFADQLGITGTYDSGTGVLTLTGTASVSDYQTALRDVGFRNLSSNNPSSPKTIEFKVNDGDTDSAGSTKNVSVTPVNDAPALDSTDAALAYQENATTAVDNGLTVADVDSSTLAGATIQITSNHSAPQDTLAFTNQNGISGSYNDPTGTLTLSGTATVAQYQTALRSITYNNNSDTPSTATRTVSFQVNDGGAVQNLSNVATRDVTVNPVDDGVNAVDDSPSAIGEDPGAATQFDVLANDTDVDGGPKEITNVSDPAKGTASIVDGSPDKVGYTPDANYCNSQAGGTADTFTYTVTGGDTATVSVTVTCADDPTDAVNDTATVAEDSTAATPANTIDVRANDTDPDTPFGGSKELVTNKTNGTNGTVTISNGGADVQYVPNANYCNSQSGGTTDSFTYTLSGGDTATVTVTVTCVNDATVAVNDSPAAFDEDTPTTIDVRANDTDADTAFGGSKELVTQETDGSHGTVTITNSGADVQYSPALNYCGGDTFTYTLAGGASATVTVNVNCADDGVDAVNDTATVDEDSTSAPVANTIDVLNNDTDVDGGPKEIIEQPSDPAHGTVTLNQGTPDTVTYVPDPDYCNSTANPAAPDTFTYKVSGGDTATVSVTVTCANDAPVVDLNGEGAGNPGINTSRSYTEIAPGGDSNPTINVAPNLDTSDVDDTHLEGATVTLTNEQNADLETLGIDELLATGKGITVTKALNGDQITLTSTGGAGTVTKETYKNSANSAQIAASAGTPRQVHFTVNDGTVPSTTAIATINIVPLNVPPNLDLNGGTPADGTDSTATFTEDGAAADLAPAATTSDVDDSNYTGGSITLTNPQDGTSGNAESISVSNSGAACVQIANNNSHAISLSGDCSIADYQTVIRSAKYTNSSNSPTTATGRTVQFKVNDGQADSETRTSTVTVVANNDAPALSAPGAQTFDEDTSKQFSQTNGNTQITVEDPDDNGAQLKFTLQVTQGTLTLSSTTGVSFTDGTANGQSTLKFTATEEHFDALTTQGAGLIYTPNSNFNGVDTLAVTVDDQGNTGAGGAKTDSKNITLNVTAVNDTPTNTVPGAQQVDEDTDLFFNGNISISDQEGNANTGDMRVTLSVTDGTLSLDPAAIGALNFGGACSPACAGDGTSDATMTFEGTVAEVNDALNPLKFRGNQDDHDDAVLSITTNDRGIAGTPGAKEDGPDTVAITVNPVNDAPVADAEIIGDGDVNNPLGNVNLQAHGNTTMQVDDTHGGTADNKSAPTNPHTEIEGDILDGDTDVDGPGPLIVQSAGSDVNATNGQTADSGTVTIEPDGDFVYQPRAEISCDDGTDSFNYKISDQANSGNGPIPGTAIGTVTIHLEGCVWYVHNNASGNAGTSTQPYDNLFDAENKSVAGDTVFVYDGDNMDTGYSTGYVMNSGERLIGEHEGLTVDQDGSGGTYTPDQLHPPNHGAHPTIRGINEHVIELAAGNEIRGFELNPDGNSSAISGGSGDAGGTIDDVKVNDTGTNGGRGLHLADASGLFTITDFTYQNLGGSSPAVELTDATPGDLEVNFNVTTNQTGHDEIPIKITKNAGPALVASGVDLETSQFEEITTTGSAAGGVSLTNTTGAVTFGDGNGTDLNLGTQVGTGLLLNNARAVTVAGAGSDTISATNAPAVDITYTGGNIPNGGSAPTPVFDFDEVDSTNSPTDGVNLEGLGTGTFDAAATSDIKGAAGISFDLSGGTGNVSFHGGIGDPGAGINDGNGDAVRVQNRTGGAVAISGQIDDDNDLNGGITLTSNTNTAINFSSGLKKLETATAGDDMLTGSGNTGSTISFTNGGLDVDATTGRGIELTGGGTLRISRDSGPANTVNTTTGRALNVENVTIADEDLVFQTIASNGAPSGIRLSNTSNSNGSLVVSGNGGTCNSAGSCTGGAIVNSTGDATATDGTGVSLTSVPGGVSLTRLAVIDSADDGIGGSNVGNGLTLDNAHISSNGDVNSDSGVDFTQLTGTSPFTNSNVSDNYDNNVSVVNASGVLNLNVTGGTYSGANAAASAGQGDGIYVEATGTGNHNLNVQGPITFATNEGDHVQHGSDAGNTSDNDVTINNATMTSPAAPGGGPLCANNIVGGGITVVHGGPTSGGSSNTDATITNNNIQNNCIGAIVVGTTGSVGAQQVANVDATIANNTIGTAGVAGSGSVQGDSIFVDSNGNSNVRTLITGNTVRQFNRDALQLDAIDGDASLDATIRGNIFTDANKAFAGTLTRGMVFELGSGQNGDSVDVCLDVGHGSDPAQKNTVAGAGESPQTDIRYNHNGAANGGSIVSLVGYAGPATATLTDIQNVFQPRNNVGGTPTVGSSSPAGPSSTTQNVASCAQPAG